MASASSPTISATLPQPIRYDVFLSFRGEDIRNDFLSHLHEALCRNQILTFIDDNLRRGDSISPSLFTAIQESIISVIIFSENYADSKWCLKELAKILQCRELNGQIVIPVFYGVDPSHIRKQTGKFGLAFDKLKERLREGEMDLDDVRSHLEEAANISGWNSQIISPESKLIKSIVGDILNKLNRKTLNLPSSLVGIGSQVERVETLLCLESPQFRIVGLWGMGGIGKTTIARAVFKHICSRFDAFHFVENVSNELRNQSVDGLREKIVLKLLEEENLNMGNRTLRHDFIMKQFQRKKVLVVLDDVDDAIKAKKLLAGENDLLFSGGSRILVTSRDKQVLKNIVGDQNQICEVKGLSKEDGVQLFSLGAFKQNHPTSDRLELSERVFNYSRGNPLALVVLGHALFDKSKEEWVSALDELGEEPFPDIQKVLRISYDALCDQEKTIFLDIASFLIGKTLDFAVAYYKGFVKRIEYKINNLVDKSLVTISKEKKLEMHNLLKEMGRSIESVKRLKKRTRIWDFKDVYHVSKKRKGSSMIEAISVNLSQVERIPELDCSLFARLDCLRFLEFHNAMISEESKVRFCWERFRGFSEELRYFRWDAYPHKSLSSKFCAENLVELHMPGSAIRKLWTGKQSIVNLKIINLEHADKLVEFPDVSEGINIKSINLYGCESLVKLQPSIQHLPKLEILILSRWIGLGKSTRKWDFKDVTHVFNNKTLKERLREGEMDLDEAASNIFGWNSQIISPESKLRTSIVGDISNKYNQMTLNLPSSIVGIGSHVERVETLLCLESPQFRVVGLWGMGGIGKKTIARAVFNHIRSRFDAFHFVASVSLELKRTSFHDLWEKIMLNLLEEENLNMRNSTLRPDFIRKQFQRKKVLIVLDDVDDASAVPWLLALENNLLCGAGGSRILITSRDYRVLHNVVDDQKLIYKVEGLNEEDSLQLFSLYAFNQNHPTSDLLELSERVLSYAGGNPFALIVLGSVLFDKSKAEWASALDGLGHEAFKDIKMVLRESYDALSYKERTIFLDISAFLVGKKLDFVAAYYEGYVRNIVDIIQNLHDKSLITIVKDEQLEIA